MLIFRLGAAMVEYVACFYVHPVVGMTQSAEVDRCSVLVRV